MLPLLVYEALPKLCTFPPSTVLLVGTLEDTNGIWYLLGVFTEVFELLAGTSSRSYGVLKGGCPRGRYRRHFGKPRKALGNSRNLRLPTPASCIIPGLQTALGLLLRISFRIIATRTHSLSLSLCLSFSLCVSLSLSLALSLSPSLSVRVRVRRLTATLLTSKNQIRFFRTVTVMIYVESLPNRTESLGPRHEWKTALDSRGLCSSLLAREFGSTELAELGTLRRLQGPTASMKVSLLRRNVLAPEEAEDGPWTAR